jgi:hypothetical protein
MKVSAKISLIIVVVMGVSLGDSTRIFCMDKKKPFQDDFKKAKKLYELKTTREILKKQSPTEYKKSEDYKAAKAEYKEAKAEASLGTKVVEKFIEFREKAKGALGLKKAEEEAVKKKIEEAAAKRKVAEEEAKKKAEAEEKAKKEAEGEAAAKKKAEEEAAKNVVERTKELQDTVGKFTRRMLFPDLINPGSITEMSKTMTTIEDQINAIKDNPEFKEQYKQLRTARLRLSLCLGGIAADKALFSAEPTGKDPSSTKLSWALEAFRVASYMKSDGSSDRSIANQLLKGDESIDFAKYIGVKSDLQSKEAALKKVIEKNLEKAGKEAKEGAEWAKPLIVKGKEFLENYEKAQIEKFMGNIEKLKTLSGEDALKLRLEQDELMRTWIKAGKTKIGGKDLSSYYLKQAAELINQIHKIKEWENQEDKIKAEHKEAKAIDFLKKNASELDIKGRLKEITSKYTTGDPAEVEGYKREAALLKEISGEEQRKLAFQAQAQKVISAKRKGGLTEAIEKKLKEGKITEAAAEEAVLKERKDILAANPEYESKDPLNFSLILHSGAVSEPVDAMTYGVENILKGKASVGVVSQDVIRQMDVKPDPKDWLVYQTNSEGTYARSSDFYVLIPRQYAGKRGLGASPDVADIAKKLGLGSQKLFPVKGVIPNELTKSSESFDLETVDKIKSVIPAPSGYDSRMRSVTWSGHGMTNSAIGGIDLDAAQGLVKHFGNSVDSLSLSTCFAAGINLEKIKSSLEDFSPGHGKMIMAVQGFPADRVARVSREGSNLEKYFQGMQNYLNGEKTLALDENGRPIKSIGDIFSRFTTAGGMEESRKQTEAAMIVRLPGSAKGFEPVAIDDKLAVIGAVKGQKTYDLLGQQIKDLERQLSRESGDGKKYADLEKRKKELEGQLEKMSISIKNKNVAIVTPDHVKTKILIEGNVPNILSGRGGETKKLFEDIKITIPKKTAKLESVLEELFNPKDPLYFKGKYFIKSLEINGEKYKNVFVVRQGSGRDEQRIVLEIYYKNDDAGRWVSPGKTEVDEKIIDFKKDALIKVLTEEVDTGKLEREKLEKEKLDQVKKKVDENSIKLEGKPNPEEALKLRLETEALLRSSFRSLGMAKYLSAAAELDIVIENSLRALQAKIKDGKPVDLVKQVKLLEDRRSTMYEFIKKNELGTNYSSFIGIARMFSNDEGAQRRARFINKFLSESEKAEIESSEKGIEAKKAEAASFDLN